MCLGQQLHEQIARAAQQFDSQPQLAPPQGDIDLQRIAHAGVEQLGWRGLVVLCVRQASGAHLLGGERPSQDNDARDDIGTGRRQRMIAYRDFQQRQQDEVHRFLIAWEYEDNALASRRQDGSEALCFLARV
jgi:hypothetical protein